MGAGSRAILHDHTPGVQGRGRPRGRGGPRSIWRLVEAQPRPRRHAPLFGEHNREILCGLLGHSEAEQASLAASGVIGDAPVNPGVGGAAAQ